MVSIILALSRLVCIDGSSIYLMVDILTLIYIVFTILLQIG